MATLETGKTLLHYRIVGKLGEGGMGEVYKAEDLKLGRPVALKLLHAPIAQDHTARRRLIREARSASALNHPNIVTIHAIEEHEGADFIVMEFVAGETLKDRLQRGPLEVRELCDIGGQIADALAAAHGIGVIHRDMKPANIVITPDGRARVLDFGLAKPFHLTGSGPGTTAKTDSDLTDSGIVVGTVAYMSPEQTRGEPLDPRSDVFSLGTVLYEASTGSPPFSGTSVVTLMDEIANTTPVSPSMIRRDLPPELDLILCRALEKDREERYASVSELADALRAVDSTMVVLSSGPTDRAVVPFAETLFVGREPELRTLKQLLLESIAGFGKLVFVTGEAGIGKTALVEEFLRSARRTHSDVAVCRGRCLEQYGKAEAYLPFLDALENLGGGPAGRRLIETLRSRAPTWCLQLPAVFATSDEVGALRRQALGATKERMLRELGDALEALASASPIVVLLEDLHWADPSSVDMVRYLSQRIGRQRMLLIGTFRPVDVEITDHSLKLGLAEMRARRQCQEMAVDHLGRDHIVEYLDARFERNDFAQDLATVLVRQTEGHPLFVTSLVQYLVDRRRITRSNEHWTLASPVSETDLEVPEDIGGMIRRQLAVLPEEDRRALQYASVQGGEFLSAVLADLLEVECLDLEEQLDRLDKTHDLLMTVGEEHLPEGSLAMRYRFRHILYQNILYEDLILRRRVALHGEVGERLLAYHGDKAPAIAAQLAMHFERAGDYRRAVEYLVHSGDNAARKNAVPDALGQYSHALQVAEQLPGELRAKLAIPIHFRHGRGHLALMRHQDALSDFSKMRDKARAVGESPAEIRALAEIAATLLLLTRHRDALRAAQQAVERAEDTEDRSLLPLAAAYVELLGFVLGERPRTRSIPEKEALRIAGNHSSPEVLARILTVYSVIHFARTEIERVEELTKEAVPVAEQVGDTQMLAYCASFLMWAQASLGRIAEATAIARKLSDVARRNAQLWMLSRVPTFLGWVHRELHACSRALGHDRKGLEVARDAGDPDAEANALINIGIDLANLSDLDEAFSTFTSAEEALGRSKTSIWRTAPRLHGGLCEYWLARGDNTEAERHARQVLEIAQRHGIIRDVAVGHKLLGQVAMADDDLESAETELDAAVEELRRYPAPLVAWKTHALLGRLRRQKGDSQSAREAFGRAAETVEMIASNVDDESLRQTFLDSAAVREVLDGAGER
jgi:tetratricopeptide (TPR) repeat protein